MALSDYLSRDEWVVAFTLYLVHAVHLPEQFPLATTLSDQLRRGLWLMQELGYRGWKGICWEGSDPQKRAQVHSEEPSALLEFMEKRIVLRNYWTHTIAWLETVSLEGNPEFREAVLTMLQERLPHIEPDAVVGWCGAFPGFFPEEPKA